jgi:MYXO-CTERM domain-containing protein
VKWNSDPGSTREQTPMYGSDVPVGQSAAGVVLLGAVLSGRRRREEEAE